ncbi:hypothetical protein K493DRAFT_375630 [Basidiobolus meristosporus CBS 931.73]|uniref:Uncharacterized protein n=1 Tax=Basidiobolus meristosporus CBS 931.73 TaxID=1314790 RepID=A0A1Y1Y6C8_9FUNG|nr:hypothetical protein K493DRAFT_375630 [Basidiobolus meristosporus CBS 931.73]|eukprot:ORX93134.1 hypothetical protein K493DRAFT_375630 [Basidiobolus meristosporus CBS 931.73]
MFSSKHHLHTQRLAFVIMADAMYVTPKATKSIVSRIGSYPVTNDAVLAINGFLDEFLYLLISYLPSDRMDVSGVEESLFRLLPHGPLAREAIRSAHNVSKTSPSRLNEFGTSTMAPALLDPLPTSEPDPDTTARYEQLRIKCLRYSTLGAEHANTSRLLLGPQQAGEDFTSITVLFITAILEYMARFLINSIAVMAKQQLRAGIGLEEVFSGLNIDGHIKELFQNMAFYTKLQVFILFAARLRVTPVTYPYMALAKGSKNFSPTTRKITTTGISRDTHEASLVTKKEPEGSLIQVEKQEDLTLGQNELSARKGRTFSSFILKGKTKTPSNPSSGENSPSPKSGIFRFMPAIPAEPQNLSHRSRSVEALRLSRKSVETTKSEGTNVSLDESFEEFLHANETKKMTLTPNRLRSIEILKKKEKYQPRAPIRISPNLMKSELPDHKKIVVPKKSETLYEFLNSGPAEAPPVVMILWCFECWSQDDLSYDFQNSKKYISRAPVIMKRTNLQPQPIKNCPKDTNASNTAVKPRESIYDFLLNENPSTLRPTSEKPWLKRTPSTTNPEPLDDALAAGCKSELRSTPLYRRRRGLSMPLNINCASVKDGLKSLTPTDLSNTLSLDPTSHRLHHQRSLIDLSSCSLKTESDDSESSDAAATLIDTPINSPKTTSIQDILSEDDRAFYTLCMCESCDA